MPKAKSSLQLKRERIKRNLEQNEERARNFREKLAKQILSTEYIENAPQIEQSIHPDGTHSRTDSRNPQHN
jgi:LPS O-antigen subunit length determinant protein (WzzB/FepE family)